MSRRHDLHIYFEGKKPDSDSGDYTHCTCIMLSVCIGLAILSAYTDMSEELKDRLRDPAL